MPLPVSYTHLIHQVGYLAMKLDEYGIPYQRPAAGDGKPEQVQAVEAVFAGHRVAVCQQIPDFAAAYACFQIELSGCLLYTSL